MRTRFWLPAIGVLVAATWFAWGASIVAPTTGGTGGSATNAQPPSATLSNIANSGLSLPYIALSTNSGSMNNVTSIVARSGIVVSNDSAGIASLHVTAGSGSQTPWSSDINANQKRLTNAYSVEIIGDPTVASFYSITGTSGVPVVTQAAASNSVPVTNVVGLIHRAAAVYIEVDCNREQDIQITNRLAANTIVNWLNAAQGQTYQLRFTGAASGGADYYVTNTFPSGWLVVNQSTNAARWQRNCRCWSEMGRAAKSACGLTSM